MSILALAEAPGAGAPGVRGGSTTHPAIGASGRRCRPIRVDSEMTGGGRFDLLSYTYDNLLEYYY